MDKKSHWENIYTTKTDTDVSWYEEKPEFSLKLIGEVQPEKNASIIDVGGGNSNLVIELLKQGYSNLSVLDISAKAIERTKNKLGEKAENVNWIVSDILDFKPEKQYDIWHDRATFHFLTNKDEIEKYTQLVNNNIKKGGHLILATFSTSGPLKCSNLTVSQYDSSMLNQLFQLNFELKTFFYENHKTPFETEQNFTYTLFQKK